jgi:hypothetical protein
VATFFFSTSAKATGLLDEPVRGTGHAVRHEDAEGSHVHGQIILDAQLDVDHLDRLLRELPDRSFDFTGATWLPSGESVSETDRQVVVREVRLNEYAGTITVVFEGA